MIYPFKKYRIQTKLLLYLFIIIEITLITVSVSIEPEISFHNKYNQFKLLEDSTDNITGTFFVSNRSTEVHIFTIDRIPRIGQKWNITFKLDSNSTTIGIWQVKHGVGMWEGLTKFNLTSGNNITNQYISHVCGDNYDVLFIRFYLRLFNSTAAVSGSFSAILQFAGYSNPQECNTGMLIVDDIDEWLNPPHPPIIDPLFVGLMVIFLITGFVLYKKKF